MRSSKPRKDHTGSRFGRLLVIKQIPKGKVYPSGKSFTTYVCRCDCGKEVELESSRLITGNTKSCGCFKSELITKRKMKRPFEGVYNSLVHRAIRDGKDLSLSYEDFLAFTEIKFCEYCGIRIDWQPHCTGETSRSRAYYLDRKDNNEGYSAGNCVVCCSRCNHSKLDLFSYEEWKHIGKAIREFREKENNE